MKLVIVCAIIASVLSEKDVIEDKDLENFFDDNFLVFGQKTNFKREQPYHISSTHEGRRNYVPPDYKPLHRNEPRLYYNDNSQKKKYSDHSKPLVESDKESTYTEPEYNEPAKDDRGYQKPIYSAPTYENELINQYKSQSDTYSFVYEVKNDNAKTHAHEQHSDGKTVRGSYRVDLPDGRIQIVSYVADDNGYRADVRYEGKSFDYTPSINYESEKNSVSLTTPPENPVNIQRESSISLQDPSSLDNQTEENYQETKDPKYIVNTHEIYTEKLLKAPPALEYSIKDEYRSKESTYQPTPIRESVVYEHTQNQNNLKSSPKPQVYSHREPLPPVPDSYSLKREENISEAKGIEYTENSAVTYPVKPSEPPVVDYLAKNDHRPKEATYQALRRGSVFYNPNDSEISWYRENRPRKSPRISRDRKISDKSLEKQLAQSQGTAKINEFEDVPKKTDVHFSSSEKAIETSTNIVPSIQHNTQSQKLMKGSEDFISQFISFQEKIDADYDDVTEKQVEILNAPRWNNRKIEKVPARAIVTEKPKTPRVRNPVVEFTENTRKSPVLFRTSSNRQSIVNDLTRTEQKDSTESTNRSPTKYNFGFARSRITTHRPTSEVSAQQPLQETTEQSIKQDTEKTTNQINKSIYSALRPKMIKPSIFETMKDKQNYQTSDRTKTAVVTEHNPSSASITKNLEIEDANNKTRKTNKVYHFTPITTSKPVRYFNPDVTTTTSKSNQLYHYQSTTKIPKVYYLKSDATSVTTQPKVYYFTPNIEELPLSNVNYEKEDEIRKTGDGPETNVEDLLFETPWEDEDEPADTFANEKPLGDATVTVPGGTFEISETFDATHNPLDQVSKLSETTDPSTAIEDLLFETAWEDEKDSSVQISTTKDISLEENTGPQSLPLIQEESNSASQKQYTHGVLYGGNGRVTVHKP